MTKKKRGAPSLEELLERPWCYYCERDFDDLKVLMQHQRAKHYKCANCNRRLNTAGGLVVHMTQVHKEDISKIENALPTRENPHTVEIFGMEGVPDEAVNAHRSRIANDYYADQAQHQAKSGNPSGRAGNATGGGGAGGGSEGHVAKKIKIETSEELKARLAAHRAAKLAKAAEAANPQANASNGTDASTAAAETETAAEDTLSGNSTPASRAAATVESSTIPGGSASAAVPSSLPPYPAAAVNAASQHPGGAMASPTTYGAPAGVYHPSYPSMPSQGYVSGQAHYATAPQSMSAPMHYSGGATPYYGGHPPQMPMMPQPGPSGHYQAQSPPPQPQPPYSMPQGMPGIYGRSTPPTSFPQIYIAPPLLPAKPNFTPSSAILGASSPGTTRPATPKGEDARDAGARLSVGNGPEGDAQRFLDKLVARRNSQSAQATPAAAEATAAKESRRDEMRGFVWRDNDVSPEEKMAGLAKYRATLNAPA